MLKKLLNEARITFHIEATGPILIKDGETDEERDKRKNESSETNPPDMRFVVDANKKIFIPGSSIRGVWRSWCEKIARTISKDTPLACDPFDNDDLINMSCSKRLEKEDPSRVYALSCPICKLFGNTSQGSRIKISDAYINEDDITRDALPARDGIGIDRFTGGVSSRANFKYQYLIGKTFKTRIHIRNFELWQLGLLGYLFRDFEEELVPLGFGKTRGLGKVKGTAEEVELFYYGLDKSRNDAANKAEISGIGMLYQDTDKSNYAFADETPLKTEISLVPINAFSKMINLNKSQSAELFRSAADYWAAVKDGKSYGYFLAAQESRDVIIRGAKNA